MVNMVTIDILATLAVVVPMLVIGLVTKYLVLKNKEQSDEYDNHE